MGVSRRIAVCAKEMMRACGDVLAALLTSLNGTNGICSHQSGICRFRSDQNLDDWVRTASSIGSH